MNTTTRLQMQLAAAHQETAMTTAKPEEKAEPKRQRRTTAKAAGPTVAEALQKARVELCGTGMAKDEQAPAAIGGYNFRGIDGIYNAIGPLQAKYGLTFLPQVQDMKLNMLQATRWKNNNQVQVNIVHVIIKVTYEISCATDPEGVLYATVYGEGMDERDKAVNKAMTSAEKNMVFQTFMPPLQGVQLDMESEPAGPVDSESQDVPQPEFQQPEVQQPPPPQEPPPQAEPQFISPEDAKSIATAVQSAGIPETAFFQWIKVPAGQYDKIKTTQLQTINDTLKEKIRERSKQQAQELAEQTQPPAQEVDFEDDIPF